MHRVRSYLNGVVAEIRWAERLSEWNHVPHFPYFVTHYVDSMPIASIGGILCDVMFNPKYAGCIYKVRLPLTALATSFGFVRWPPLTMEEKDSCVLLRVATNVLFMAFLVVHDVCYVKGR